MKGVLNVLTAGWFISLIGAILAALLIWFVGPLVAIAEVRPLEGEIVRLIIIIVIFVVWGLANLFAAMRRRKADDKMAESITESAAVSETDTAAQEEAAILKERLEDALQTLKKAKLGGARGRQNLYQLPWYIIIGPPGAGKTTALVNSGLKFPLADKYGKDALRGVGGTRNCDWWFTDEAVLIDTAGRYTMQDSQRDVDQAAWQNFLGLLKKHRPRQPINGAIVAISLSDLALLTESERESQAREIRKRVRELHESLGIRFPIYVIFTKADLVAGFIEFFDDLDREEREQVWGATFPMEASDAEEGAVDTFAGEFDLLLARVNERMLERVHQEPDVERRSKIFGFPTQVASLRQTAIDFLAEAFKPSRLETRPMLRGVYFTSGTQEGTPIDRLMGAMASTFGLDRQRLSAFSGTGRSYFLGRLLRDVVFGEASVVSANSRYERHRRWIGRGAVAVVSLVVALVAAAWIVSFIGNSALIDDVEAGLETYKSQIEGKDLGMIDDTDLLQVVEPLNTLRDMPAGYASRDESRPLSLGFGLYQGDKLHTQAVHSYRSALNSLMLPRMLVRLEEQIAANLDQIDFVYEALKVYLMLGGQGPLDEELVKQWMAIDWNSRYPGGSSESVRQDLQVHLAALLDGRLSSFPLDGRLIDTAQRTLAQFPLAERVYGLIRDSAEAREIPEWRPVDHAGPSAARVFTRRSGRPLSEGIPGIYSREAFHDLVLPTITDMSELVAKESWVLGKTDTGGLNEAQIRRLEQDVLSLYLNDYATRWDELLADLQVKPFENLSHAVEVLNALSAPNSPLRELLRGIVFQTTLSEPPDAGEEGVVPEGVQKGAEAVAKRGAQRITKGRLQSVLGAATASGSGSGDGEPEPPGTFIDRRFQELHELVEGGESGSSRLDSLINSLNDLYLQLNRVASSGNRGDALLNEALSGSAAAQSLRATASRLPQPMSEWVDTVVQGSSAITAGGARSRLNDVWSNEVRPLCQKALANRYPFSPNSETGVTINDFARLFAPGGLIDGFFSEHLSQFVDTSQSSWRYERVDNVNLGLSGGSLRQFQRAATIRDAFFASGSQPSVQFEIVPVALDPNSTQVLIEVDGQVLTYSHGPLRAIRMQWPGSSGVGRARLAFSPASGGQSLEHSLDGPWAWFRLLDRGQISRSSLSDRFTIRFSIGDREASFDVRASSVMNPFSLPELEEFSCPNSL